MSDNPIRFKQLLETTPALKAELQEAARSYEGDRTDDRAVFDAVIAPLAASLGVPFTYGEALEAIREVRELSDEELEGMVGGLGIWYRIVTGTLVATLAVGTAPAAALASSDDFFNPATTYQQYLDNGLPDHDDVEDTRAMAEDASDCLPSFSIEDIASPE